MLNNMNAIVYICHGSRANQANEQAISFVKQLMQGMDAPIQELGFLELTEPTISVAVERCIAKGATSIFVIPILLLTAGHAKVDIPNELDTLRSKYKDVSIMYGTPIGVNEKMIDLLIHRIEETKISIKKDSTFILVGRGSSDPDVKRDLSIIGKRLATKTSFKRVEVCFLTATDPRFTDMVEKVKTSETRQVFIIPYLFFSGVLMKNINKTISKMKESSAQDWILCQSIGYHSIIQEIFKEQIDRMVGNQSKHNNPL